MHDIFGNNYQIKNFYIIFEKSEARSMPWWTFFLDTKFQHCYVIIELIDNLSIIFNPVYSGIEVIKFDKEITDVLLSLINTDNKVSAILSYSVSFVNNFNLSLSFSCASTIASMLFIDKSYRILTPKMLYKALLSRGARPILYQCPYGKSKSTIMSGV